MKVPIFLILVVFSICSCGHDVGTDNSPVDNTGDYREQKNDENSSDLIKEEEEEYYYEEPLIFRWSKDVFIKRYNLLNSDHPIDDSNVEEEKDTFAGITYVYLPGLTFEKSESDGSDCYFCYTDDEELDEYYEQLHYVLLTLFNDMSEEKADELVQTFIDAGSEPIIVSYKTGYLKYNLSKAKDNHECTVFIYWSQM